jgi:heptosyltransferase II
MSTLNHKILIVGPAWVGDMVMAQSLFKLIKQKHPDHILDVVAPSWSVPLLERMPEIRRSITIDIGHGQLHLQKRFKLGYSLRQENYQQAILLPNSFKSALVPLFAKIKHRTGWRGEMRYALLNDLRYLDKQKYPLMIERFMALALQPDEALPQDYPLPSFSIDPDCVQKACDKLGLHVDKPILALCPGAEFGPAKRWPEEHYAAVAKQKLAEGWQVWIFGSKSDQAVAAKIQQLTENQCIDLTGKTSLAEAIDLLSLAACVVSNDSGLMHIAAALGKLLVVVYGSTDPGFTPPLAKQVKVVRLGLDCSPCFKRECPLQHLNCLRQLAPELVVSNMEQLLDNDACTNS